jgi:hypothetical protein
MAITAVSIGGFIILTDPASLLPVPMPAESVVAIGWLAAAAVAATWNICEIFLSRSYLELFFLRMKMLICDLFLSRNAWMPFLCYGCGRRRI